AQARAVDTLDELADQAVKANPSLVALEHQAEALDAKARGVRRWMDPMLAVEYSNFPVDSWALGDTMMTGIQLKLIQKFPFPGKNDRREAVALAEAEAKRLEREEAVVQLRAAVKRGALSLALVRQLKQLTVRHIAVIEQLRERVRLRYEVGKGNQKDVLQLNVLHQQLTDEIEEFDRKDAEITATINRALHRDVRTPIDPPAEIAVSSADLDLARLIALAEEHRPALKVIEQRARVSRLNADRVEWEQRPDFSVWIGYRIRVEAGMDDGTDFMSLGASIPIPFDYTNSTNGKKAQHLAMAAAADEMRAAALDGIASDLERSLATWLRALSKERNYKEQLVPEGQRSLEASLTAYETGRADFSSIFRAELDLIRFERTIRVARVEAAQAKVAVEALVGAPIDQAVLVAKEAK
ncbi:MAG: TolC family protein, partial [Deltaproteobacteria bacterium]|nr:TolC family protein [Deltaproteobacteria bacterium]